MPWVFQTGVYEWLNLDNGHVYVGGAYVSFAARKATHLTGLRHNNHKNRHLQAAWNKYGEDAFEFKIIERCAPERVEEREQWWLDQFKAQCPEIMYNLSPTAGSTLGMKQSDETRAKVRAAVRKRAGEISKAMMGNQHGTGKHYVKSPAQRRKLALALMGKSNWSLGKPKPAAQRAKLSAALTGKKQSPETIAKRVAKLTGQKRTEEQCQRISQAKLASIARRKEGGVT